MFSLQMRYIGIQVQLAPAQRVHAEFVVAEGDISEQAAVRGVGHAIVKSKRYAGGGQQRNRTKIFIMYTYSVELAIIVFDEERTKLGK